MQTYASTIDKEHKKVRLTAEKFNKDLITTRKYLIMSKEEIQALDNPKKYKKREKQVGAANYFNLIYKMIKDGHNQDVIYWYIMRKGFEGTKKQLENAIDNIAKNNFGVVFGPVHISYLYQKDSIVITRNELLKEITTMNPHKEHTKKMIDNLKLIEDKYPIVRTAREIYNDFYYVIMGNNSDKLDEFILKYETKKDEKDDSKSYKSPISSFINGLKKDILPAKNAISFSESSGFVEGNNNKFKLIKRILYGRANLVNLFRKCYLCFSFKKVNFSFKNAFTLFK